jgi:hypothetical protein
MKVLRVTIIALVCMTLYLGLRPGHVKDHSPEFATVIRLNKIGNAIEHYSYDHDNQLPAKLSALVPNYIGVDQLSLFYPPDLLNSRIKGLPSDWKSKPELVDTFSDCVYLGTVGISRQIIAYEREGEWNRADGQLHIIPPHGGLNAVTKAELDELLHASDSAVLERMRKQRVTYYEANLHASLNWYRIDFGSYPHGDNAAVTRVLRGENPSKKQYHSGYEQERNAHGEDLDPWGTPYLIASDGSTVRIKSAGSNRQFDQLDSTNYDDICFSITGGSLDGTDTKF